MENKSELEIFTGIGQDEIDKRKNDVNITDKEIDKARERLNQMYEEDKIYIKKSYLKAYDQLSEEVQNNISEQDINDLVERKKINNIWAEELYNKRKEILQNKNKEIEINFYNNIDGDMNEKTQVFNAIKRQIFIGAFLGMPGAIFFAIKDHFDKKEAKMLLKEAFDDYTQNGDSKSLEGVINSVQKKFGKILDVKGLVENMKSSDIIDELKNNKSALNAVVSYRKETEESEEDETTKFLNEMDNIENIETEEEINIEEEDEAPVEGIKNFM